MKQPAYETKFDMGLPRSCRKFFFITDDSSNQTIVMHQPGMIVEMTEFFPSAENVIKIWESCTSLIGEAAREMEGIASGKPISRAIVECNVLKVMKKTWDAMSDYSFIPPMKSQKRGSSLFNDQLLENPYVPDDLLNSYYFPYDQTQEGNFKSLGVVLEPENCFTDASFQRSGVDLLLKFLKLMILKNRLHFTWIDGGTFT